MEPPFFFQKSDQKKSDEKQNVNLFKRSSGHDNGKKFKKYHLSWISNHYVKNMIQLYKLQWPHSIITFRQGDRKTKIEYVFTSFQKNTLQSSAQESKGKRARGKIFICTIQSIRLEVTQSVIKPKNTLNLAGWKLLPPPVEQFIMITLFTELL